MSKKIFTGSLICLSVIVFTAAILYAKGSSQPYCDMGMGPGSGMGGMFKGDRGMHRNPYKMLKLHADEIGLTEDQLNNIEQKSIESKKAQNKLNLGVKNLRVGFQGEMEN